MGNAELTSQKAKDVVPDRPFLLATKLYVPRPHPTLLPRPHLIERLDACLNYGLTLVSAPAGFGKTTLVARWIRSRQDSEAADEQRHSFAWVSLDANDNDLSRFLTYFVAALQSIDSGLGGVLGWMDSPAEPAIDYLLSGIVNDIAHLSSDVTLVFDDFHLINEPAIHDTFAFLLDNQPPNLHLIIISRADPPWPLARLRAQRKLHEIRARDMRFSPEETARFLNDTMQLSLTAEEVSALENRTEGWIAGLQMAALSMRDSSDRHGFIRAFTGSNRFILDYLLEEVLSQQPSEIQDFLLKSSVLRQMSASICDAILNRSDSQALLSRLERQNLFLVPLDDERRWYRYHHLFSDLLVSRLTELHPDQPVLLHRQASSWYEDRRQINEAVHHAMLADDFDLVSQLIGGNALVMAYHGELRTLIGWLDELSSERVDSRAELCVAKAWILGFSGQMQYVEPWLQKAEQAMSEAASEQEHRDPNIRAQSLVGQIAVARTYAEAFVADTGQVAELARKALKELPPADLLMRAFTTSLLGIGLRMISQYEESATVFNKAVALSQAAGDTHLLVDVLWERSKLESAQGQLNKVMETCQEARQLAEAYALRSGRRLPVSGYIYERMSTVKLERNDLDAALRFAQESIDLCQRWGNADALVHSSYCLANALVARSELSDALSIVQSVEHLIPHLGAWYASVAQAIEAEIRLMQGDQKFITDWTMEARLVSEMEVTMQNSTWVLTQARFLLAQDRYEAAMELLSRLLTIIEATGATGIVIRVLTRLSTALYQSGDTTSALAALERALTLARPENYRRVFLIEGTPMREMLNLAAGQGLHQAYVSSLLSEFPERPDVGMPAHDISQAALVEPPSSREMDVLQLLNSHLSSTEIADMLSIAPSTVRSHIKNIYSKLDVHNRTDAVTRARQLNLLPSSTIAPHSDT